MRTFAEAATGFPTIVFTAALVVVVGFWLLVAVGAASAVGADGTGSFGADADLDAWGMGGVPVTVAFSLLAALAWFISLSATVLLAPFVPVGVVQELAGFAVLVGALLLAWRMTRFFVRPLHRLFPDEPGPSRQDFVGLTCTVRTGWVDAGFGQAEVAAPDGSTAVVQVRQNGSGSLTHGSTGLLYAYDEAGEFFWVAPYDTALDPRGRTA